MNPRRDDPKLAAGVRIQVDVVHLGRNAAESYNQKQKKKKVAAAVAAMATMNPLPRVLPPPAASRRRFVRLSRSARAEMEGKAAEAFRDNVFNVFPLLAATHKWGDTEEAYGCREDIWVEVSRVLDKSYAEMEEAKRRGVCRADLQDGKELARECMVWFIMRSKLMVYTYAKTNNMTLWDAMNENLKNCLLAVVRRAHVKYLRTMEQVRKGYVVAE